MHIGENRASGGAEDHPLETQCGRQPPVPHLHNDRPVVKLRVLRLQGVEMPPWVVELPKHTQIHTQFHVLLPEQCPVN